MFGVILALHNLIRWIVVIFAAYALFRAYRGWLACKPWTKADRQAGSFFTMSMDIQVLLGLILYFILSGLTRGYITLIERNQPVPSGEMAFFGLEHILVMIVAVGIVHFGSVLSRRLTEPVKKFRAAALSYTLAVILIIIAIPWWRPLIRV